MGLERCKVTYPIQMYHAPPIDKSRCPFTKFLAHSSRMFMLVRMQLGQVNPDQPKANPKIGQAWIGTFQDRFWAWAGLGLRFLQATAKPIAQP
jgi:hypothetical protein